MNATKPNHRRVGAALLGALALQSLIAQTAPSPAANSTAANKEKEKDSGVTVLEAFVTTGSNILRVDVEKTLPVTVFNADMIEARNSTTPMDLLIGIPEITNIPQNETSTNAVAARGGNANVALRGLGSQNTLVLLNGRRLPFYPFSAGTNVSSVNVQSLPVTGLSQIEVLRDGASAIYGSDAVAGVINYVTDKKADGLHTTFRYGVTEHGGGMDVRGGFNYGLNFAGGKGLWLTSASAYYRDKIFLNEREESASTNRISIARPPWNVAGSSYDGSTSVGIYPSFYTGTSTTATAATTYFYPTSGKFGDTPALTTTAIPRSLYANYNDYVVGQPQTARYNVYNRVEYELTHNVRVFGEVTGYLAKDVTGRQPITLNISDSRVQLAAANPYNPYGSAFYDPNGDGVTKLKGTPVPLTVVGVLLTDGGPEQIRSTQSMYRVLGGFGGTLGTSTWTWETAAMVGGVYGTDFAVNSVRDSYLRAAALRTDATAWNPFGYTFKIQNGAVVANQPYANPKSVRDYYTVSANRYGHSKIASYDAHIGGTLLNLWAGPLAASVGAEWRYEFKEDHKDAFAGINPAGTGPDGQPYDTTNNDILVMSPKVPYAASRTIVSGYAETAVPLAAPKNQIRFANSLELNASVRTERFSDFGTTTKPKFGVNWKPVSGLILRGSVNQGFHAPDLADLYRPASFTVTSPPGARDTVRNNYFISAGLPSDVQILTKTYDLANPGLQPEQSKGRSVGIALDVPKIKGLSISVDYWEITQNSLILAQTTTSGLDNQLLLAYTQQQLAAGKNIMNIDVGSHVTPSGANNYVGDPFVLRNPVSDADKALFAQTYAKLPQSQWIAPLGTIVGSISQNINSTGVNFTNGLDYNISYSLPRTRLGQFRFQSEWSQFLNKFTKTKPGFGKNDDLMQMTTPRFKSSTTIIWRKGGWDASLSGSYTTAIRTGANTNAATFTSLGNPDYIKPVTSISSAGVASVTYYERGKDQLQLNAGIGYRFGGDANKWLRKTAFRLAVNNLLDKEPSPTNLTTTGYSGSTGSSLWIGRAYSLTVNRDF